MDTITVLFCQPNHLATKIHTMTAGVLGTVGYNAGMYFESQVFPVNGIHDLAHMLGILEPMPNAVVIRGEPSNTHNTDRFQRRLKVNFQTPKQGNHHVMIDIDKLALPTRLKLTERNLERVVNYVISQLPPEFQNVSFYWQLSSSAGIYDRTKISIHLWFWFDRPISDDDLKRWGKAVNTVRGYKLIDTALFNDVQAHYTAAPIFNGMNDPFPVRSGLVEKEKHEVELVLPAPDAPLLPNRGHAPGQSHRATGKGFNYFLSQIGDHGGGDGFHEPIIRAIASHVATVGRDNVDKEWLFETVRQRVLAADSTRHESAYINLKASPEYIFPAIDGAITKFGDTSRRKPRVIHGQKPHFVRKTTTVIAAEKLIKKILVRIF